jgi:hypothetical protein
LPAASLARIVTVFDPTSSGTVAFHCVVPVVPVRDAVPDPPVLVVHVTEVTPTLSLATPLKTIDAADVETDVEDGVVMVNEGGVVFDDDVGDVGVGAGVVVDVVACVRVIAADCETSARPSVAVTAMVFDPTANGTPETLHAAPAVCPVPDVP